MARRVDVGADEPGLGEHFQVSDADVAAVIVPPPKKTFIAQEHASQQKIATLDPVLAEGCPPGTVYAKSYGSRNNREERLLACILFTRIGLEIQEKTIIFI